VDEMGIVAGGKEKNLGSKLDLVGKMETYKTQRRLRSSAFIFLLFAILGFAALLVVPYYLVEYSQLQIDIMQVLHLFVSVVSLLLLCSVTLMLYAILNLLENQ